MLNPRRFVPAIIEDDTLSPNKKWKLNHPVQASIGVERSEAGSLMPSFIGNIIKGFCSSVDENIRRESFEKSQDRIQADRDRRVNKVREDHEMWMGEPPTTKDPATNSAALFLNDVLEMKKVNVTGNLSYPWSPTLKGNLGVHLNVQPMKVEKLSIGACWTPKCVRESNRFVDIQPYCTLFTNGSKKIGIVFTTLPTKSESKEKPFQKPTESYGLSQESLSEEIPSPNISFSEGSPVTIPSEEENQIGQNSSVKKGLFEKVGKHLDNTSIYLKDTSKYLTVKIDKGYLEVALFRSVVRGKWEYVCIAIVLIFIRVVATRVEARGKIDGLSKNSKKYKINNVILSWSTQYSSLALSFFCFPIASHLTNLLVGSVVVFVRAINSQVLFCWFVRFIPFGEHIIELFLYSILLKICADCKACINKIFQRLFNFILKNIASKILDFKAA